MAFDYDSEVALGEALQADEKFRDRHMATWRRNIQRFAGPMLNGKPEPDTLPGWRDLFYHKYLSIFVPSMTSRNPRVLVSTGLPELFADVAHGVAAANARWHELTTASATYHELAYDYLLLWAVSTQTAGPVIGGEHDDPWSWPAMTRMDPTMCAWDCDAHSFEKKRRAHHAWIADKEDVEQTAAVGEEDGWNLRAVRSLPIMDAGEHKRYGWEVPDMSRSQVILRDVWFPEVVWSEGEPGQEEALDVARGINGGIMTVAVGNEGAMVIVRAMQPYYGPRTGPYSLYGYHKVPSDPYPMSPLVAVDPSIEDSNAIRQANRRGVQKYRRGVIVGGTQAKQLSDKIEKGDDYFIWNGGPNIGSNNVIPIEVGGLTDQLITQEERAQIDLEESAGMSQQMQGAVEGDATATEVVEAASGAQNRSGGVNSRFMAGQESANRAICFFLTLDDTVLIPLGKEHATPEMPNPVWQGGNMTEEQRAALSKFQDPMDAMQITVKPYSGAPVTAMQVAANADRRMRIAAELSPAMVQNPHIKWRETLQRVGEATNDDDLENMVDWNKLAELQELFLKQAQQPEQGQQSRLVRGVLGVPGGSAAQRAKGGFQPGGAGKMTHLKGGQGQSGGKQGSGAASQKSAGSASPPAKARTG